MDSTTPSHTAPLDLLKSLSGLEFLQRIIDGRLPQALMAQTLRFAAIEVEAGKVMFEGIPGPEHYNPIGTVHGGYACTLLDSAMSCAVQSMCAAGMAYTTLELKVNLVRPITTETGPVRAEGSVVHVGRRTGTAEGKLLDASGKLLAHGTTTCLIFPL